VEERNRKRISVFQKVDINQIDFSKIPYYPKSKEEMNEILAILKENFLTRNLSEEEIKKLATTMKQEIYKRNENIIKYGDIGTHYFLMVKGKVKVTVYRPGTDPADRNLHR